MRRAFLSPGSRSRLDIRLAGICALLALSACSLDDATSPAGTRNTPTYDYVWGPYQLLTADHGGGAEISHTRVIGATGGQLALGLHELVVPAGAVSNPTVFRMSKKLGPHIVVDLEATDHKTGRVVDTFAKPVELRLSYRLLPLNGRDLNRMVIFWLKDGNEDGELVPIPTRIDHKTKQIVGSLMHFSQYAMGMN